MVSEHRRVFWAYLISSSCAQSLHIDVVLKTNESRVLSSVGKGAAKSLIEKHYGIPILILKRT